MTKKKRKRIKWGKKFTDKKGIVKQYRYQNCGRSGSWRTLFVHGDENKRYPIKNQRKYAKTIWMHKTFVPKSIIATINRYKEHTFKSYDVDKAIKTLKNSQPIRESKARTERNIKYKRIKAREKNRKLRQDRIYQAKKRREDRYYKKYVQEGKERRTFYNGRRTKDYLYRLSDI